MLSAPIARRRRRATTGAVILLTNARSALLNTPRQGSDKTDAHFAASLATTEPQRINTMTDQPKLQAVIFDWAGTDTGPWQPRADGGVRQSLRRARRQHHHRRCARPDGHGQARPYPHGRPGARRRRRLASKSYGRPFGEADIDAVFDTFEPLNIASVRDHAEFHPRHARNPREAQSARPAHRLHHRLHAADHGGADPHRRRCRLYA